MTARGFSLPRSAGRDHGAATYPLSLIFRRAFNAPFSIRRSI
jgi:hypothetical protein